jgi:catechol 2,3-dioxygenase-like lactoylglutathione lyase family enzyme
MAVRIAHANLQVTDIAASIRFYERLGLALVGCLRLDPIVLYYMATPDDRDVTIELTDNPGLEQRHPGSGHVALAVGDMDALLARLAEAGIEPSRGPLEFKGGEVRVCFVTDPDGHAVELCQGNFPTPRDPLPEQIAAKSPSD